MNFLQKSFFAFGLCCICFLLLPQAAWSQDFSSIDRDLEQLEGLIADTLQNTQEQQKLLEDLRQSLNESGNLKGDFFYWPLPSTAGNLTNLFIEGFL